METATRIIVLVVTALLIVYDVIAYLVGGNEATISLIIYNAARDWPLIPFAAGVLCGHLFWPLSKK